MKKVYLASSLTQSSGELKTIVEELKTKLRTACRMFEYFGLGPGQAREVYLHDKKCIDESDFVVAECSQPSLGVGYEIGYALSAGKKVYAFAKEGIVVSRMIIGITDPNFTYQTYKNVDEIIETIKKL